MDTELIVFVNEAGQPIGSGPKLASHHANTKLHLAFSCYVFNQAGKFLVTKRADHKKVWPSVWTNSCCGHPAPGEAVEAAVHRRLQYELGLKVKDLQLAVKDYTYQTPPYNGIIEHEFCPIYLARAIGEPAPNPEEVAEYQWLSWEDYVKQLESDSGDIWSWWAKDQLKYLESLDVLRQFKKNEV